MPKRSRRGPSPPAFPLPLDLVLEVAARSDPATLVRCATASKDLRRRVADPAFRGRLRLRLRHADRFVPSLMRGHLVETRGQDQHLVDYATGEGAATGCFVPSGGETPRLHEPMAARDASSEVELRVCNPVTGRSQTVPRGPRFHGQYVLLVGDSEGGTVGRPFQVLKVTSVLSKRSGRRCLQIQTFSSVHGTWSPRVRIGTPNVHGGWLRRTPLVANGAVHWLCRSDTSYYIFKLDVGAASAAAQVTATKLPASFHAAYGSAAAGRKHILLATKPTCRNLCVLVTDDDTMISIWSQSGCSPARWGERPEAVIKIDGMMTFTRWVGNAKFQFQIQEASKGKVRLEWFAERSGVVLISAAGSRYFWLDLRSREIFRCSSSGLWTVETAMSCPYEMDVSSWVPTFGRSF
ncbi:hypothetical protein C2845_PM06G13210 [Panicum miliaceum]|uniref:DUF7595 domain-containing protein n=1 Tax=Panicum miliaceum TaxID=4540 RepID=A0A3L6R6F3_PANMI|nr:hypothetical protein C2845_PM06G13210 [Panicum miliaceum]